MTAYAIVEHIELAKNSMQTAARSTPSGSHLLVGHATFSNPEEFAAGLCSCVSALLQVPGDAPRLLVISAHGIALTGTDLEASDTEAVRLDLYADHFAGVPAWVAVYVSACFGGYPAACAIQRRSSPSPCVVGPLVDIKFSHANEMQSALLDLLHHGQNIDSLRELVKRKNDRLRQEYEGREAFGVYDSSKEFFPESAQGAQLAAPVSERSTYTIEEWESNRTIASPAHALIRDESGVTYRACSVALLRRHDGDPAALIGRRFVGKHQTLSSDSDPPTVVLVQVRWR